MATKGRFNPFGDSSKDFVFFPSLSHRRGVHRIVRGLESDCGLILLTGEIGIGKTSLAKHIQRYLADRFVFVELGNPYQTPLEQMFYCCEKFGLPTTGVSSIHDCVGRLEEYFHEVRAEGKKPVIVFDESHLLTKRHLSLIHILSNLRASDGPLLQILIVGQLEILDLLRIEGMEALNQRIGVRCELSPLGLEDTDKYISFKLDKSGGGALVSFSRDAVEKIWRKSNGLPRLINHVCAHALDALAFRDTNVVSSEMVDEVCCDAVYSGMFQPETQKAKGRNWRLWAVLFATVCLAVLLSVWLVDFKLTEDGNNDAQMLSRKASQDIRSTVSGRLSSEQKPYAVGSEQAAGGGESWEYKTSVEEATPPVVPSSEAASPHTGVVDQPVEVVLLESGKNSRDFSSDQTSQRESPPKDQLDAPEEVLPPQDQIKDGSRHPVLSTLVLGAIAWNESPAARIAIINSGLYHEGESVDGVKLIQIGQEHLVFEYFGEFYQLEFPK